MERLAQMPAAKLVGAGWRRGHRIPHHALCQIESLLKVHARIDERPPAHPQVVERMGARFPIPPSAPATLAILFEIGVPQRAAGCDRRLDLGDEGAVLL